MRLSVTCPETVRQNARLIIQGEELDFLAIEGGLLHVHLPTDSYESRTAFLNEADLHLSGRIADANSAVEIHALGQLKSTLLNVRQRALYESYIQTRASELEEATSDIAISHSHAEQNTSNSISPEQQSAAPENEETINEQAHEEAEQPASEYAGFYGQRV